MDPYASHTSGMYNNAAEAFASDDAELDIFPAYISVNSPDLTFVKLRVQFINDFITTIYLQPNIPTMYRVKKIFATGSDPRFSGVDPDPIFIVW